MEHIEIKNSLDSKLQSFFTFSIRIFNILKVIAKQEFQKTQSEQPCCSFEIEKWRYTDNYGLLKTCPFCSCTLKKKASSIIEPNKFISRN